MTTTSTSPNTNSLDRGRSTRTSIAAAGAARRPTSARTRTQLISELGQGTRENRHACQATIHEGVLGLSKTAWGQSNLPLDLTYLGMPGCSLFTSGELVFPVVNSGGTASLTLAVPNSTQLVGCLFYNQALVLDPPANAFGAILSNAGEGKLGAK